MLKCSSETKLCALSVSIRYCLPLWSKWSLFLASDPEVLARFPELSDFLSSSSLERGPLSLVSTSEELFGRKRSGPGLENQEYGRTDQSLSPRGTLYRKS
jgi:hypothetical protein